MALWLYNLLSLSPSLSLFLSLSLAHTRTHAHAPIRTQILTKTLTLSWMGLRKRLRGRGICVYAFESEERGEKSQEWRERGRERANSQTPKWDWLRPCWSKADSWIPSHRLRTSLHQINLGIFFSYECSFLKSNKMFWRQLMVLVAKTLSWHQPTIDEDFWLLGTFEAHSCDWW